MIFQRSYNYLNKKLTYLENSLYTVFNKIEYKETLINITLKAHSFISTNFRRVHNDIIYFGFL